MVNKELIEELQEIIWQDYGLELTGDQAFVVANKLTNFFETLIYGKEAEDEER